MYRCNAVQLRPAAWLPSMKESYLFFPPGMVGWGMDFSFGRVAAPAAKESKQELRPQMPHWTWNRRGTEAGIRTDEAQRRGSKQMRH